MTIRPLNDRIVVQRQQEEKVSSGGILIPDSAKEKPVRGTVVATGNGKLLDNGKVRSLDVKSGDTVLFGKYAGTEIKVEGIEYLILREDDIMGVFTA